MAFSADATTAAPVKRGLLKRLTSQKKKEVSSRDKMFYQITCIAGGAVALISAVILLVCLAGYDPTYVWSAVALGLGSVAFYALAYLRYQLPGMDIIHRFSDASVYLVLFGAYTPIQLILIRQDLYQNGSILCGWLSFGLVAGFSALFFITSLCSTTKLRLVGSFCFILMAFSLLFGTYALMNAFYFSHFLMFLLMIVTILSFAATPIFFWFFDKKAWQFKVFYILMAVGTLSASLMSVLYALCGR